MKAPSQYEFTEQETLRPIPQIIPNGHRPVSLIGGAELRGTVPLRSPETP